MNPPPSIQRREFGQLADGRSVHEYTLTNGRGLSIAVLELGGIVNAIHTPDREGRPANVVLGLARWSDWVERNPNFGTLVGRYANRIAGARFSLDGQEYALDRNSGPNCLHGGSGGFGRRCWTLTPENQAPPGCVALRLDYRSADGEGGFPGNLDVQVRYTLTPANEWIVDYAATTDRPTVVNLSQHAYFNLAGSGSALDQRLTLAASRFTPVDEHLIPLDPAPVDGTPFDFRQPTRISKRLRNGHLQLELARGYDHNWLLDGWSPGRRVFAARLEDEASGRCLEIETTEPAIQFYSGNFLDGSLLGSHGEMIRQGDGVCLETQHWPDSPNRPEFPSTVLRPGERFSSSTCYRFGVF